MEEDLETMYLTSMWAYTSAGVDSLKRSLKRHGFRSVQLTYEQDHYWFKITCLREDMIEIQKWFADNEEMMEFDIQLGGLLTEDGEVNPDFSYPSVEGVRPDFVARTRAPPKSQKTPRELDNFPVREVWDGLSNEGDTAMLKMLLSKAELEDIARSSGDLLKIKYDLEDKEVFVGGQTVAQVRKVLDKLDTLLRYDKMPLPNPAHLLYSEKESKYTVDSRYMEHINPDLIKSTIFDPVLTVVPDAYGESCFRGVALRICTFDYSKNLYFSLLGPRPKGASVKGKPRRWSRTFFQYQYPTKSTTQSVSVDAKLLSPVKDQPQVEGNQDHRVIKWLTRLPSEITPSGAHERSGPHSSERYERADTSNTGIRHTEPSQPATSHLASQSGHGELVQLSEDDHFQVQLDEINAKMRGLDISASQAADLSQAEGSESGLLEKKEATKQQPTTADLLSSLAIGQLITVSADRSQAKDSETDILEKKEATKQQPTTADLLSSLAIGQLITVSTDRSQAKDSETDILEKTEAIKKQPTTADLLSSLAIGEPVPFSADLSQAKGSEIDLLEKTEATKKQPKIVDLLSSPAMGELITLSPGFSTSRSSTGGDLIEFSPNRTKVVFKLPPQGSSSPGPMSKNMKFDMEPLQPVASLALPKLQVPEDPDVHFHATMNQKAPSPKTALSSKLPLGPKDPNDDFVEGMRNALTLKLAPMRVKAGELSLRIEFGRICLANSFPNGLAFNKPTEPANGWDPDDLIYRLNKECITPPGVRFTRVLSLWGHEADYMLEMKDDDGLGFLWKPTSKGVIYRFHCSKKTARLDTNKLQLEKFVIDIDGSVPNSFTYRIGRQEDRLAPTWVHCLHRQWDFQISVSRNLARKFEGEYGVFAKGLLDSMEVPEGSHMPLLTVMEDVSATVDELNMNISSRMGIDDIQVLHVARAINEDWGCYLNVTKVQTMKTTFSHPDPAKPDLFRVDARPATEDCSSGRFTSWYEAAISSVKAEAAFRENEELETGKEAEWTVGSLEQDGVFAALYGPATAIVKKMDSVGGLCDNGLATRFSAAPTTKEDAGKILQKDDEDREFW